jgi:hypothetical protein
MLWGYTAYSQYLIVWSANLPREAGWFLRRTSGGWERLAALLLVFQFAVPFFLLLFRRNKRRRGSLGAIALGILAMRVVDLFWLTAPPLRTEGFAASWTDAAAFAAIGGLWAGVYLRDLARRPLAPAGLEAAHG